MPHFLDLATIEARDLHAILDEAQARRAIRGGAPRGLPDPDALLDGRILAIIFTNPSTRTRLSFEVAMRQMGGHSAVLTAAESHLGRGESMADTARIVSRLADVAVVRTRAHSDIMAFAEAATIPVVNGLTDHGHPCQIMACLMTLRQRGVALQGARLAWVGDGNNVCASFVHAASAFGYRLTIGAPPGYALPAAQIDAARARGADVIVCEDARAAVKDAQMVIADTFFSMSVARSDERMRALMPFQVNAALMESAAPGALFAHCLPAYRGEEVTAEVIDGPVSTILDEAENKVYLIKAVLAWSLGML